MALVELSTYGSLCFWLLICFELFVMFAKEPNPKHE